VKRLPERAYDAESIFSTRLYFILNAGGYYHRDLKAAELESSLFQEIIQAYAAMHLEQSRHLEQSDRVETLFAACLPDQYSAET